MHELPTHLPPVRVTLRGDVPEGTREYVEKKIGHVREYAHEPVLDAHAILTLAGDPARERPALAEATLDVNGTPVRAQVAAAQVGEAIDLLEDRLRRRLVQHQDWVKTRHRWIGIASEHEWRHGDLPTQRPEHFPRPPDERQVVRRKTFALEPMTPDEAAFDMDLLSHDFHLFTDLGTGQDVVIYRKPGGRFGLRGEVGLEETELTAAAVDVEGPARVMSEAEAVAHLDVAGVPFVFYLDPAARRGRVLYLRYDGHYGLITGA
ncbi:MAG TPA: HPF/RaiA family ribosome-associated protein [Candidatus Eisenbacteria bacterium]|nr:HPF/RaiA family ribosome-associated protein [Candidatus Eisenbacteria bacterium]